MTGFLDTRRPPGIDPPEQPQHVMLSAPRPTPLEWARRRRTGREARRAETARDRVVDRLARLGAGWKLLDVAELGLSAKHTFLAIGPGGIFLVCVKPHGRSRVRLAGDVVQVDGRRLSYIAEVKGLAQQAAKAISRTAGSLVPVAPVLAFAGNGVIDVHGLPKGCLVTSYRELDHLLGSYGERIGPSTVSKLYSIARHPVTWVNPRNDAQADAYRWYSQGTATDKEATRR
jgi:hypothetical protein